MPSTRVAKKVTPIKGSSKRGKQSGAEGGYAVEMWPLHEVKPYEKNARKISATAIEKVAKSLSQFGWRQPMVVDKDGVLIVGHNRRLGALHLGWAEGPVHVARDLSPAQIKAYRLMDNRSHEETAWDLGLVTLELLDLQTLDMDLSLTGFNDDEISKLLTPSEDDLGAGGGGSQIGGMEYRVVVECNGEAHQAEVLEELEAQGLKCKALIS